MPNLILNYNNYDTSKVADISKFSAENALDMYSMFSECFNLEYKFDKDINLHLYITSQFYGRIIKMNEYLYIIDDNITFIDRIYDQIKYT